MFVIRSLCDDAVDSMYGAMSQCQLLHPDTDDEEDGHQLGEGHDGQQLGEGQDSILMSDISESALMAVRM